MARTSLLKGLVGGVVAGAVLGLILIPKTRKEVQQSIWQQDTKFQRKFAKKPSLENETLQPQGSVVNFSATPPPLTITKVTPNSGPC